MTEQTCTCACGSVSFTVRAAPLFRILCHCTICQRFNDAPFADVAVYDATSVSDPAQGRVTFDTYKPPPNVQRGRCAKCGNPAIERFSAPLLPRLTMVPASMFGADGILPGALAHIFYDTRVADADDALPKHEGFLASQLSFARYLLAARLAKK
ncbi:MAG: GFA family protein [Gammaproteobacteria bacterium]